MNFLTYRNQSYGVEISYPMDWDISEDFPGVVVIILAPQEDPKDMFRENLNILVQDLTSQPMTMDEYTQLSLAQFEQTVNKFKVIDPLYITNLSGMPAYRITYNQVQGKFKLIGSVAWTLIDNTAYVLTVTAGRKDYDKYEPIFNEMIKSFKIL